MPLITDPDLLSQGTEVTINTSAKTIALNIAGNLTTDGVTLQGLYSFLKEEWKNDSNLIKFPFPMLAITNKQFELLNGWDFANLSTKRLIRSGGWALKDGNGVSQEEWAGIISLGTIGSTDQVYYQQANGEAPTNIVLTGPVNQAVQIYGDATHGNFDKRSFFKIFVREYQKSYASAQLSDIGVSTMTYEVYSFPLQNSADLKITNSDVTVGSNAPYTGIDVTFLSGTGFTAWTTATSYVINNVVSFSGRWYRCISNHTSSGANQPPNATFWEAYAGERQIGSSYYAYNVIVDGNNATAEQIYEKIQYLLRQNSDIDSGSGTVTGKTAADILEFVGDTLKTKTGVYVDSFSNSDRNRIVFRDLSATERTFPYVAILTLQFNENLRNDPSAIYRVFFTNDDAGSNAGNDYGTANAIIVNDNTATPMSGNISGAPSVSLTFDYDANVQRGAGSAGTDAPITVIATGLGTAQFVSATGTIQRSISNVVSLTANLERNYQNT